jgi:hypothetical protein
MVYTYDYITWTNIMIRLWVKTVWCIDVHGMYVQRWSGLVPNWFPSTYHTCRIGSEFIYLKRNPIGHDGQIVTNVGIAVVGNCMYNIST